MEKKEVKEELSLEAELKLAKEKETALMEENESLIKENEQLKAEDYKDKWMRSVAEFDNYKKRNAKIWQDAFSDGKTEVIIKVLTVGDNLERAAQLDLDEKTKEGINLVLKNFNETLKNLGVEEINPVGEKFDPNLCEAVMQAEKAEGQESETVNAVFLKGYKLNDKIIRYAKVSVIK